MRYIVFLMVVFMSSQSYAYLDPGASSLLLQSLIAGAVGGFFTVKMYWTTIKARLFKKKDDTEQKGL